MPGVKAISGLKVATRPVAESSNTDAAVTLDCAGPVSVKIAALMVAGSMRSPDGTLKVALTDASVHTPVVPAAGLVESIEMLAALTGPLVAKVQT